MVMKMVHIMEIARSRVLIENGKIIIKSKPKVKYCPIHAKIRDVGMITEEAVKDSIEWRMKSWGLFKPERKIKVDPSETAVSFGASEILASGLSSGLIDCAITVCEGAGTVITSKPEICQGIGAVLSCIIETDPIQPVIDKLKDEGVLILEENSALIDQKEGVEMAIERGFNKIGVTVRGPDVKPTLREIARLEKKHDVDIYYLVVSTSGVKKDEVELINKIGDIVWSCASKLIREIIAPRALMQVGISLPAYVLTKKGKNLVLNHIGLMNSKIYVLSERQGKNLNLEPGIDPPQPFI